jgi:hypothetical protein
VRWEWVRRSVLGPAFDIVDSAGYSVAPFDHWQVSVTHSLRKEAEIRKIAVQGQPKQIVCETSSPKLPEQNGLEAWL